MVSGIGLCRSPCGRPQENVGSVYEIALVYSLWSQSLVLSGDMESATLALNIEVLCPIKRMPQETHLVRNQG